MSISNIFFILPETIQSAVRSSCILADSTPIAFRKSMATNTPHATVYRRGASSYIDLAGCAGGRVRVDVGSAESCKISHRRHHERRCADPMR
ncbi:hypothetical protein HYDPIDRAFT_117429 [Hydnomerulius pinastri MD-312]|uniref:Uncharacterized protein n=1 Tax=Hydnomerulius pinastri MD-312 TaxID=994086 RepID=A0A0C9W2J6_9AGAM|nr:hypothetical protein HYDPIDRAFT_117429 [Hydnomerulius pinastri MD-312]